MRFSSERGSIVVGDESTFEQVPRLQPLHRFGQRNLIVGVRQQIHDADRIFPVSLHFEDAVDGPAENAKLAGDAPRRLLGFAARSNLFFWK